MRVPKSLKMGSCLLTRWGVADIFYPGPIEKVSDGPKFTDPFDSVKLNRRIFVSDISHHFIISKNKWFPFEYRSNM